MSAQTDPSGGYLIINGDSVTFHHIIPPSWMRLIAHVLDLYADGAASKRCDDFSWPAWFPVAEREPLVRALSAYNNKEDPAAEDLEETEEDVARWTNEHNDAPPVWHLAGFFSFKLNETAGGAECQ